MQENWNAIVDDLGPRLYRYFRATLTEAQSEDCVQETLIRLWNKMSDGQYDSAKGSLRMYAYGIAGFVRLEAFKSKPQIAKTDKSALDMEEAFARRREAQALRKALLELSSVQQQILCLYIDEELTMEQIAALLDQPVGTVKSHIHRAKLELKNKLNPSKDAL